MFVFARPDTHTHIHTHTHARFLESRTVVRTVKVVPTDLGALDASQPRFEIRALATPFDRAGRILTFRREEPPHHSRTRRNRLRGSPRSHGAINSDPTIAGVQRPLVYVRHSAQKVRASRDRDADEGTKEERARPENRRSRSRRRPSTKTKTRTRRRRRRRRGFDAPRQILSPH